MGGLIGQVVRVLQWDDTDDAEEKIIATEEQIAIANRALELKKAEIEAETDAARAR